jgi:hypothetical protein
MKRLPMRKIRDVLRLSAEGLSTRQLAASLAIGRTTLQGYLDRARDAELSWPLPPDLSDTDLERLLYPRTAREAPQRRDLMEIVEERYGRGSTMITSQLPIKAWHDVIGEPTFADAILDRIVHNAYRLDLEGQSMRRTFTKKNDEIAQT